MDVELRAENAWLRRLSPLGWSPGPKAKDRKNPRTWIVVGALFVVLLTVVAVFVSLVMRYSSDPTSWFRPGGWSGLVIWVAMGTAVVLLIPSLIASQWWGYGAGEPVLQVAGGRVRGRIRAARRRPPHFDGWDFDLPLQQVGIRMEHGVLILELPAEKLAQLSTDPVLVSLLATAKVQGRSPVRYEVAAMLGGADRHQRAEAFTARLLQLQQSAPAVGLG